MKNFNTILKEAAGDKHWMASFSGIDFWVKNIGTSKQRANRDEISEAFYEDIDKVVEKIVKNKKYGIKFSDIKTITIEFKK